jgi:hypothetical protein
MKRRTASFQTLARALDRHDLLPKGRNHPRPRERRHVAQPPRTMQQLLLAPCSLATAHEGEEGRSSAEGDAPCHNDHLASEPRLAPTTPTTAPAARVSSVGTTKPGDGAGTASYAAIRSAQRACARGARPSQSMSITSHRSRAVALCWTRATSSRCAGGVTTSRPQASAHVAARGRRSPRVASRRSRLAGYPRARSTRHRAGGRVQFAVFSTAYRRARRAHFLPGFTPPRNAPAPIST